MSRSHQIENFVLATLVASAITIAGCAKNDGSVNATGSTANWARGAGYASQAQYGYSQQLNPDSSNGAAFFQSVQALYNAGGQQLPGNILPNGVSFAISPMSLDPTGTNYIVSTVPQPVITFTIRTDHGGPYYITIPAVSGTPSSNSAQIIYQDSVSMVVLNATQSGQNSITGNIQFSVNNGQTGLLGVF